MTLEQKKTKEKKKQKIVHRLQLPSENQMIKLNEIRKKQLTKSQTPSNHHLARHKNPQMSPAQQKINQERVHKNAWDKIKFSFKLQDQRNKNVKMEGQQNSENSEFPEQGLRLSSMKVKNSKNSVQIFPKLRYMRKYDINKQNGRLGKKISEMISSVHSIRDPLQLEKMKSLRKRRSRIHSISMVQKNKSAKNYLSLRRSCLMRQFAIDEGNQARKYQENQKKPILNGHEITEKQISIQKIKLPFKQTLQRANQQCKSPLKQKQQLQTLKVIKKKLLKSIVASKNNLLASCHQPIKPNYRYITISEHEA